MNITVVPAAHLTDAHVRAWRTIQADDQRLRHPLLSPDFARTIATIRSDVYVGVLENKGRMVGFFPHQRGWLLQGRPVGGPLNTFQAIVAERHARWDAAELVASCGLSQWTFTRALASQSGLQEFHLRRDVSGFIDLSSGYGAYVAEKSAMFRSYEIGRRKRNLERDAGPLRFVTHSIDPADLGVLLRWKAVRYARQAHDNVFTAAWTQRVLEAIQATQTPAFAGTLSLLHAGGDAVAAHLGIRSQRLLHSLVFSYNPRFARYSPGLVLFFALAEAAATIGIDRIELGGGDYRYKRLLANDTIEVAGGTVDRIPLITAGRRWREHGADWIRASRLLRPPARLFLRTCRRLRHSLPA